jgi:hypothetical protein
MATLPQNPHHQKYKARYIRPGTGLFHDIGRRQEARRRGASQLHAMADVLDDGEPCRFHFLALFGQPEKLFCRIYVQGSAGVRCLEKRNLPEVAAIGAALAEGS